MKLIIVNGTTENIELAVQKIKEHEPDWATLNSSCIMVKTKHSAIEIRDMLHLECPDCRCLVIDITDSSWASFAIASDVTTWMKKA